MFRVNQLESDQAYSTARNEYPDFHWKPSQEDENDWVKCGFCLGYVRRVELKVAKVVNGITEKMCIECMKGEA